MKPVNLLIAGVVAFALCYWLQPHPALSVLLGIALGIASQLLPDVQGDK